MGFGPKKRPDFGPITAKFGPKCAFWAKYSCHARPKKNNANEVPRWFSDMWVPKLLLTPKVIRMFSPKTAFFAPKYAFLGTHLVPYWLVVVAIKRLPTLYLCKIYWNWLQTSLPMISLYYWPKTYLIYIDLRLVKVVKVVVKDFLRDRKSPSNVVFFFIFASNLFDVDECAVEISQQCSK